MKRWVASTAALLTVLAILLAGVGFDTDSSEPRPSEPVTEVDTTQQVAGGQSDVWLYAERLGVPVLMPQEITLDEYENPKRCPQFIPLFKQYGLEPVDTFSYIAWRETRCNPDLINAKFDENGRPIETLNRDGSYDVGLLQINSTWKTVTHEVCGTPWGDMFALLDLHCNLSVAKYLLENGGLGHWSL